MNIGAAIISKNEEDNITKVLSSIGDYFSQIVLIDTGSTDNTVKNAIKSGADVYFAKWKDNFSEVRNIALSHISTDWIMAIDCDEFLPEEEILKLNKLKITDNIGGIRIKIINNLNNGQKSIHKYTRIFRNTPEIRYKGRIHEQIQDSILDNGFDIIDSEIKLFHNGYFENDLAKQIRNKKLLLMDIRENPNDDWLKYHLANTEFAMKNFDESFSLFKNIYKSNQLSLEQKEMSMIRMAQISLENNEFDSVLKYSDFNSKDKDIEGFRQFVVAASKMHTGKYTEAHIIYKNISLIGSNLVNYRIVNNALNFLNNNINN